MKPTILCVDDERLVLVSLKEQLTRHFGSAFRIETAENAQEALELVEELVECGELIPLVISDQMMPGIKGDELLARLHIRLPSTLKIMLTGEASASAVGAAVNAADLYRFIGKPWAHDDLMLTVREALASFDLTRRLNEQAGLLSEMHEVALDLTASLAVSDRHARLLASALRVFPADAVYIHRVRSGRLELLKSTNPAARAAVDASLYPELLKKHAAVRMKGPEAREAQMILATDTPAHDAHIRLLLLAEEGPIGLVSLFASARNSFDEISDERISGFGALVAASLRTTQLVDQIEELSEQRRAVAQHLHRAAAKNVAGPLQGKSEGVGRLRAALEAASQTKHPVLLVGPTGAGSEVSARNIHDSSLRSDGPFIVMRCAGVDETEAVFANSGGDTTLQLASGGTLYFDRVDRLSLGAQRKLSQFIARESDVRIIASVDRDPGNMIRQGEFDAELGEALKREIIVPALRQRVDDIPLLAEF